MPIVSNESTRGREKRNVITEQQVPQVIGATAYSSQGEKIGKVGEVYFDDRTGTPAWLTVNTGLFGTKETFIPSQAGSQRHNGDVEIDFDKSMVKDAPRIDTHQDSISPEQAAELYRYYGLGGLVGAAPGDETRGGRGQRTAATPDPPSAPVRGTVGDAAMTRSEEHLNVGTERVETGRVRLRKYVVTENVQTTVPVSHEEVRLEREPITDANRDQAMRGSAISEGQHEVTLHADRPVVNKVTEPVERVRLTADEVLEEQTVSGQVRKERIEMQDGSADGAREGNRRS